jgi:hypothetical protein
VPLGMFTCNGTCAAHLLMQGAVADKKMLVHPDSSIAVSFIDANNVGGVQLQESILGGKRNYELRLS